MIDLIAHILKEFPLIKWACAMGALLVLFGSPSLREVGFYILGLAAGGTALVIFVAWEWEEEKKRDRWRK